MILPPELAKEFKYALSDCPRVLRHVVLHVIKLVELGYPPARIRMEFGLDKEPTKLEKDA